MRNHLINELTALAKKDKDIIKKVKEEYEKDKNFKFKGIDCSSKIMELSYGLFLLFVLFC